MSGKLVHIFKQKKVVGGTKTVQKTFFNVWCFFNKKIKFKTKNINFNSTFEIFILEEEFEALFDFLKSEEAEEFIL